VWFVGRLHKSDAYAYMLGFDAPLGQNPLAVGLAIQQSADKNHVFERESYTPINDDSALHCNTNGLQCFFDTYYGHDFEAPKTEVQRELIRRYREFMLFNDYAPTVIPVAGFVGKFPEAFWQGQRLSMLDDYERLVLAMKKDYPHIQPHVEVIVQKTDLENRNLKRLMEQAVDIIVKTRLARAIGDNLNMLSMLKAIFPDNQLQPITALTREQRSFKLPAAYELYVYQHTEDVFRTFESSSSSTRDPAEIIFLNTFNKIFYPYFIKENMMTNNLYRVLHSAVERSELSPIQYYPVAKSVASKASWLHSIRTLGLFKSSSEQDYDKYVSAMFALDAKIEIFNTAMVKGEDIGEVFNPFYGKKGSAYYLSENKKQACIPLPVDNHSLLNCLPVAPLY
jgi:hypothetical protein